MTTDDFAAFYRFAQLVAKEVKSLEDQLSEVRKEVASLKSPSPETREKA